MGSFRKDIVIIIDAIITEIIKYFDQYFKFL